jgi:hypothetical protein
MSNGKVCGMVRANSFGFGFWLLYDDKTLSLKHANRVAGGLKLT